MNNKLFTSKSRNIFKCASPPISKQDYLSPDREALFKFSVPSITFPIDKTVVELFQEQAQQIPDAAAVVFQDQVLTYKELNRQANRLAHWLRTKGIKRNTIAAVLMERSLEMIVSVLAILKAGGVYLAIDIEYPENRVLTILEDSAVDLLLVNNGALRRFSYTALQNLQFTVAEPRLAGARPLSQFDDLPLPDRSLVDYEKYSKFIGLAMVKNAITLQATRGCPFKCEYCHRIWPRKHSMRSAENIFSEVEFYYKLGIRQFAFIDDIFNFDIKKSTGFFKLILEHKMDVQLFFTNGMRGDILTKDYIDLMFEAGTVNIGVALETASPRLQKLLNKNLDLERFRKNIEYICENYPNVILDLTSMHGLPTETEEEALMTLDFIMSLKWVHFPYAFVLKIHPNTGIGRIALENGIPEEAILRSMNFAYHDIPETLPFSRRFAQQYKARFMNEYFLLKERLLHVLPYQMKIATEDELVQKYNNYLPIDIRIFPDILSYAGISKEELGDITFLPEDCRYVPHLNEKIRENTPIVKEEKSAFRVLLMDLSELFSGQKQDILHGEIVEPLGLIYIMTYLKKRFGTRVQGKVVKSRIDFDNFEELKNLITLHNPDLIGIRTLSYYKDFFHRILFLIKEWGFLMPIISGGPYATMDYKMMLQDPNVDLAVLGEGEITFAELVEQIIKNDKKLPDETILQKIKGIAFIKSKHKKKLIETRREIISWEQLQPLLDQYPGESPEPINKPEDSAFTIYTSGSTGRPKGILQTHRCLANVVSQQVYHGGFENSTRVMQFSSVGFDVFIAHELFFSLLSGGTLYVLNEEIRKDLIILGQFIAARKIQWLLLPVSVLKTVIEVSKELWADTASIKHIASGGEQLILNSGLTRYLQSHPSIKLHNFYGPAETHNASNYTLDNVTGDIEIEQPIGVPAPNVWIYILSKDLELLPVGVPGEIYISGAGLAMGYLNNPQLTSQKFISVPFRPGEIMYKTGDKAQWLADGNIRFLGRIDEQVKIRAQRIELGEIEKRLLKYRGIKDAAVVVKEYTGGEKYLAAYFTGREKIMAQDIREYMGYYCPAYMIPTYFTQIQKFPLSPNGKVDKKALPDPELPSAVEFEAPVDDIEGKLVNICAVVLGLNEGNISTEANFFELGGHSLKATILISKIYREFDVKVSLGQIFKNPSIKGIAAYLRGAEKSKYKAIKAAPKKKYYPVSSSQKEIYILNQQEKNNTRYNLHAVMTIGGDIDKETFEVAWAKLIRRQESLRTRFGEVDSQPVQVIKSVDVDNVALVIEYDELTGEHVDARIKDFIRPFDLSRAPLFRVGLVKTGKEKSLLIADIHSIIADSVSMGILIDEFTRLYNGEGIPPLSIQFKDYVVWQQEMLHSKQLREQETYWLNKFDTDTPTLNLPLDFPRTSIKNSDVREVEFEVSKDITDQLKKLAIENDATVYMVLLAAYNILLYKYTGHEDIVVGSSITGRVRPEFEKIIGAFFNTLAMRNYPSGNKIFIEFLKEIKENSLAAFENQDYPAEELVKKLNLKRDFNRNPLFDTIFNLQNKKKTEFELKNSTLKSHRLENRSKNFDIKITMEESGGKLICHLEYAANLFKAKSMEKFLKYFLKIIDKIIEYPGVKISDLELPLLTEKIKNLNRF